MVGSYAPPHSGHLSAMSAASEALSRIGESVVCHCYVPNRDQYVLQKVHDPEGETWNAGNRISRLMDLLAGNDLRSRIDDISISDRSQRAITDVAINTICGALGIDQSRVVIVVGSDQVTSVRPHLLRSRAVCVLRPGHLNSLTAAFSKKWFRQAVSDGTYLITERSYPYVEPSSSAARLEQLGAREKVSNSSVLT
jgi:nicotinic acid mononucleotide adenylyltransferase